jgi:DNA-binding NarL/FixJ family response regulator
MAVAEAAPEEPDAGGLTPRELDVLRLLAKGLSNPEIADALYIGRGTVRTHVSNILAKLEARTRTEAAMIARDRGLL